MKKIARFKQVIRKKLPSAEVVPHLFTRGNNCCFMRGTRVAFDHLVPRNVSVFSRMHLFRMDDQSWRETMGRLQVRRARVAHPRQLLPDARQKIPGNVLKKHKNSPPELFVTCVQRLEAMWHVRRRHSGLEIAG